MISFVSVVNGRRDEGEICLSKLENSNGQSSLKIIVWGLLRWGTGVGLAIRLGKSRAQPLRTAISIIRVLV
ncbi:hypothetical protein M413DRAFT_443410 [Hebeloma cylindrosporum]|uniref:Uncharacterized protein n=1 Tax=Hebeloma cylindrosporum TaxID=76867 RepID=A0A0C3CIN5_HEBCY|nr:hypothetical protein M413DRAFT_443410 [Hebeloma cylindrosporum h7]